METKLKITGNWNELKTGLKQKYPNLTDEDLSYSAGKEDELLTRLSKKLGKTQEEVSDVIDDLQSKSKGTMGSTGSTGSTVESSQKENKQPENKQTAEQTESSKKN